MPDMRGTRLTPGLVTWSLLLGLAAGPVPAWAQAAVDMDDGTRPTAPVAAAPATTAAPAPPADRRDNIQDGVHYSLHSDDPAQDKLVAPANAATVPANQTGVTAAPVPDLPEPVSLDRPKVVDTGKLADNGKTVPLFGIVGQQGEAVHQLEAYLASTDGHLTCPAQTSSDYVCLLSDGTDIAAVALVNGAARARDDAPDAYKAQEADAQANRRGIWASLPPPPTVLDHPTVQDTATLVSGYQRYILDGLAGQGQPYARQLQGYIAANGDRATCQAQATPGHYICVLDNGTDVAKIALVNGAARVGPDAPDSYRAEQLDALNNRRGVWLKPPAHYAMANAAPPPSACCAHVAGDDGGDGVNYVGGEPTAVIGGETVFLMLAGAAGWGYYDHYHHWRDAPGQYRSHMEQFHPDGHGLRAYRPVTTVAGPPAVTPGGFRMGAVHTGTATFLTHSSVHPFLPRIGGFVHPALTSAETFHPAGLATIHPAAVAPAPPPAMVRRR